MAVDEFVYGDLFSLGYTDGYEGGKRTSATEDLIYPLCALGGDIVAT